MFLMGSMHMELDLQILFGLLYSCSPRVSENKSMEFMIPSKNALGQFITASPCWFRH